MKKIIFFLALIFTGMVWAQTETESAEKSTDEEYAEKAVEDTFKHQIDWSLGFAPVLILNTEDVKYSAPSPVVFPFSFQLVFPAETKVSFQPRLSIFANYLLWYDGDAYPAEIENRTALAFNFLADFPCMYRFDLKKKHMLEAGGGVSLLIRFAQLANGLDEDDEGYSGTAGKDVEKINGWFWDKGNFLYLNGSVDYLYAFSDKISAGPEFRMYLPVGSIFSGRGMTNAMFSLGVKVRF